SVTASLPSRAHPAPTAVAMSAAWPPRHRLLLLSVAVQDERSEARIRKNRVCKKVVSRNIASARNSAGTRQSI
ncbi:hypothetical protein, partial [Mycoplasmoides pneumoniae]